MIGVFFWEVRKCILKIYIYIYYMIGVRGGKNPLNYIKLIKDIYDKAIATVRTNESITSGFSSIISLHWGSTLHPYLFALPLEEI